MTECVVTGRVVTGRVVTGRDLTGRVVLIAVPRLDETIKMLRANLPVAAEKETIVHG